MHDAADGQALPRSQRLRNSDEFRRVFSERHKTAIRYGSFHVRRNGLGYARLGITVSRKVSKSAVERNRLKRLVREYFRRNKVRLADYDVVFTAFPGCAALSNQAFLEMIDQLWRRTVTRCAR